MDENYPAKPEYATAKIAVWWDMKDCPVPEGYDACHVRGSLEVAFKKLGYSGPVSITAYADQKQTPDHLLQGLASTGISLAHSIPEKICTAIYSDILEWRRHNPPPAIMMLISDHVDGVLSWDLARLQQQTYYNLFRAFSFKSVYASHLLTRAEWLWKSLLLDNHSAALIPGAKFYCKSCSFDCQSLEKFRKHLSSRKHLLHEAVSSRSGDLDPVTRKWGKNYPAKPQHSTAPIGVWWDMEDCPIPEGYDARWVRPSLETAFKSLGYSGPVSITAYTAQKQTPDHLLQGLSSTGVDVAHSISTARISSAMFDDIIEWRDNNPPPATMMLISDQVEQVFDNILVWSQQSRTYNLFLAYSFRPYKMSVLVTSAEWLWDSLLAVSDTAGRQVVEKCSERTGMFYCKLCFCDYKGLDHFKNHLSSKQHALREDYIYSCIRSAKQENERWIGAKEGIPPKGERLRKASHPTGFRLRLTCPVPRLRAKKSQTSKKEG